MHLQIIKVSTFTCNCQNYLANLAPAYATFEGDVDFEIVYFLPPFGLFSLPTCTCENKPDQGILVVYKVGEHVDHIVENSCTVSLNFFHYILKSIILLLV